MTRRRLGPLASVLILIAPIVVLTVVFALPVVCSEADCVEDACTTTCDNLVGMGLESMAWPLVLSFAVGLLIGIELLYLLRHGTEVDET